MSQLRHVVLYAALLKATFMAAQPAHSVHYNRLLHEASVMQAKGEVAAALQAYDSAFANVPWGIWSISEAADLALRTGDTARAINYIELLYARGGEPLMAYSDHMNGLFTMRSQAAALDRARHAHTEWAAQADSVWIKALLEMRELDQIDRSDEAVLLQNDSINIQRLLKLTEERGYPSEARVGSSAGIVTLLFWHHWLELKNAEAEHFWTLTEQAIDRGEVPPEYLCSFVDRGDFDAGKPMRYGTLLFYFHKKGNIQLIDREELNRNRASVGLETIEDFALVMELDLDAILAK